MSRDVTDAVFLVTLCTLSRYKLPALITNEDGDAKNTVLFN